MRYHKHIEIPATKGDKYLTNYYSMSQKNSWKETRILSHQYVVPMHPEG
jgi:hypothetical protein